MVVTLAVVSLISFAIIQLPPGDFVTSYVASLSAQGSRVTQDEIESLRILYGLDQPFLVQYAKWLRNIARGTLGYSFSYNESIVTLLRQRVPLTLGISVLTLVITYAVAIPLGIISAVRPYSIWDYTLTALAFIGVAVPSFLLALVLMFVFLKFFGVSVGGLFSIEYVNAAWSWAKLADLIRHLWAPIIVVGASGMASLTRVMRGTLLDELRQQYVETARAKGLAFGRMLLRYPVRLALNPIVSTVGWILL